MEMYRAFTARKSEEGGFAAGFETRRAEALPEGEVTVRVAYSSVNYKDGLAATPNGKVVAAYPRTLGIDLAGVVTRSESTRFREGDRVVATGYGLGVSHDGGFAELARLPADWLAPLPEGLSPKEAMILGTAGLTAALSIKRLEDNGLRPEQGPASAASQSRCSPARGTPRRRARAARRSANIFFASARRRWSIARR